MSVIGLDVRRGGDGPAGGTGPDRAGGTWAVVTIERPERRNALDTAACRELATALGDAEERGARAVVLAGADGNFCAGADLGTVRDDDFHPALRRVLMGLVETPMVCIAAVEGAALGAGVQLAVACDLRVARPDARFGVPAGRLGLAVDHWTVQRCALLAGQGSARAMLLGGQEIDGDTALRTGFVQRPGGPAEAAAWAQEIAALAPLTLAAHKLALNRLVDEPDVPEVVEARRRAWASRDLEEGIAAFRERRPPRFEGR